MAQKWCFRTGNMAMDPSVFSALQVPTSTASYCWQRALCMHRNFQTCSTTEMSVALERSMTANNSFSLLLVCKSGCPLKTSGILSPFTNKQVADFETLDERQAGTTEEFLTLPTHSPQLFLSFVVPQSSLHLSTTAESHFLFFFFF